VSAYTILCAPRAPRLALGPLSVDYYLQKKISRSRRLAEVHRPVQAQPVQAAPVITAVPESAERRSA
jgi:hypothetical protein